MLNLEHDIFIDNYKIYIMLLEVHLSFCLIAYFPLHYYGVNFFISHFDLLKNFPECSFSLAGLKKRKTETHRGKKKK